MRIKDRNFVKVRHGIYSISLYGNTFFDDTTRVTQSQTQDVSKRRTLNNVVQNRSLSFFFTASKVFL